MKTRRRFTAVRVALAFAAALLFAASALADDQAKILHAFGNYPDGSGPSALIFDADGNLYGTTNTGGRFDSCGGGCGTVFELKPTADGEWMEMILYHFRGLADGGNPSGPLIFDAAGNLYGTTNGGGAFSGGTVFKLSRREGGGWSETVLHSFGNGADGVSPSGGLTFDAAGNLYGETTCGGSYWYYGGTVFELSPNENGSWTEVILHSFERGADGSQPRGSLILDAAGNLYGVTASGGGYKSGIVFELSPTGGGAWGEKVLHNFARFSGGVLPSSLVRDAAGNLYGATCLGGSRRDGTVYEMLPNDDGSWTKKVLRDFGWHLGTGSHPWNIILDSAGNLYGTTSGGGGSDFGTAFELMPEPAGGWTHKMLHNFGGSDGDFPYSSLILDAGGNLYGSTGQGGAYGGGVVFELIQ